MATLLCCGKPMQETQIAGRDKSGQFTYTFYWCNKCFDERDGPRQYVPGTAARGAKAQHVKDNGKRGPEKDKVNA